MHLSQEVSKELRRLLKSFPVVVVTDPRQVGKTSLVQHLRPDLNKHVIYLDLEYPADFNKLSNPVLFLESAVCGKVKHFHDR